MWRHPHWFDFKKLGQVVLHLMIVGQWTPTWTIHAAKLIVSCVKIAECHNVDLQSQSFGCWKSCGKKRRLVFKCSINYGAKRSGLCVGHRLQVGASKKCRHVSVASSLVIHCARYIVLDMGCSSCSWLHALDSNKNIPVEHVHNKYMRICQVLCLVSKLHDSWRIYGHSLRRGSFR
jgi:hypothetical protein